MTKLAEELAYRNESVAGYAANMERFRLMIAEIDANHAHDADLLAFKAELVERLAAETAQWKRENLTLTILKRQMEAA